MQLFTEILEAVMIFCFGLSWPVSIRKSWISRTAKGKSLVFEIFLLIGYVFGMTRKIIQWSCALTPITWTFLLSFAFYILNFVEISIDVCLYFRNVKLDKARKSAEQTQVAA